MKIKDILKFLDKNNEEFNKNLTPLAEELGHTYYYSDEDNENIKVYWLNKWLCTDTEVGQRIYFLNGKPVCYSTQSARKENEIFYFFDEDCMIELKKYFFNKELEIFKNEVNYKTYDDELSTVYNVEFNDHLDNKKQGYIGNELVEIVERIGDNEYDSTSNQIKIKYKDGKTEVINVSKLNIPINLKEKFNDSLEPFQKSNELDPRNVENKVVNLEEYIDIVKKDECSYKDEICLEYFDTNNEKKIYKLSNFKNASLYFKNLKSLFDYYYDVYGDDFEKEFKSYQDFCKYYVKDDVERKYIQGNEHLNHIKNIEFKIILK